MVDQKANQLAAELEHQTVAQKDLPLVALMAEQWADLTVMKLAVLREP